MNVLQQTRHPRHDVASPPVTPRRRVDPDNQSTIGRLAALTLAEPSLDIAFLSSSSWDALDDTDADRIEALGVEVVRAPFT